MFVCNGFGYARRLLFPNYGVYVTLKCFLWQIYVWDVECMIHQLKYLYKCAFLWQIWAKEAHVCEYVLHLIQLHCLSENIREFILVEQFGSEPSVPTNCSQQHTEKAHPYGCTQTYKQTGRTPNP